MAQSIAEVYLHIVFSTKHRAPAFADTQLRDELHRYLGGACDNLRCPSLIVGGYIDHVHIACRLSKSVTVENLIRELKVESSKWIKTKAAGLHDFHWQAGYGALSVSPSHLEALIPYLRDQEEHHQTETYQDELRRLVQKYGIKIEDRFLWD